MHARTAHFILFVRDQAASRAFYEAVLGQRARLDVPGMTELDLASGAVLGLMPQAGITRLLGVEIDPSQIASGAKAELYLLVPDPAAHHQRAIAAGGRELSPLARRDWGHIAAYCLDLDGHVLAFATPDGT